MWALSCNTVPRILYRAKLESVAAWAEQGNFRSFGSTADKIESWRAERTWWGLYDNGDAIRGIQD